MAHRIFLVSCRIFHCGAQLSNCDVWVQSLPWGMWDLPGSGIKLASSALQGRFFFFPSFQREAFSLWQIIFWSPTCRQVFPTQLRMREAPCSLPDWRAPALPTHQQQNNAQGLWKAAFRPRAYFRAALEAEIWVLVHGVEEWNPQTRRHSWWQVNRIY